MVQQEARLATLLTQNSIVESIDIDVNALSDWIQANIAIDEYLLVVANGKFMPSFSKLPAETTGFKVRNLSANKSMQLLDAGGLLSRKTKLQQDLSTINSDECIGGINICVAEEVTVAVNVNLVYWFDAKVEGMFNLRQELELSSYAKLNLQEIFVNNSNFPITVNFFSDYSLADNTKLVLAQQQIATDKLNLFAQYQVLQASSSSYQRLDWVIGSKLNYSNQLIVLEGDDAKCDIGMAVDLSAQELIAKVNVIHVGVRCESKQNFCAVARQQAIGAITSKVEILDKAYNSSADQTLRGLLLDNSASLAMQPELEIATDQVKCSHGASVGALDVNGLLYLQARGLSLVAAKQLMMQALFIQLFAKSDLVNIDVGLKVLLAKWQRDLAL